ncbi:cupin domain-containing protein [Polaromonas sp.]|uniref:cupin domain-containing protein n=1 Tax=Polaromonas sp. TaxID=1869339 RepID=UPI00272FCCEE|nr:cupin domain-containing protein [Polaromonas sp.]MDP1740935.1 cupin domain-containing protein [Polaromonas sp.]
MQRFEQLLQFEELNHVLDSIRLPSENVRVVLDNVYQDYSDADDVAKHLGRGATLIVNKIHQSSAKIHRVVDAVAAYYRSTAVANLYLSQKGVGGFGVHYDAHDVFILQVQGSKRWKIHPPTTPHPLFDMKRHDRDGPALAPYFDLLLRPGEVLYIPRGHWHCASAETGTSMHLTVGVNAPTGIDFLKWLADELVDDESWRRPLFADNPEALIALVESLGSRLRDQDFPETFWKDRSAGLIMGGRFRLPYQLAADHFIEFPVAMMVSKRPALSYVAHSGAGLEIFFHGKVLELDGAASSFVNAVEASGNIALSLGAELRFGLSRTAFEKLIRQLIAEGYIQLQSCTK